MNHFGDLVLCKTAPFHLTEPKQRKTYIQILSQVSWMQWGISKDVFNTIHNWPQLGFSFHVSGCCFSNCLKGEGCFLLKRPPRSALCRGLLALGSPLSLSRADRSSQLREPASCPGQPLLWNQWEDTGNSTSLFCKQFAYLEQTYCRGFFGGPSAHREEVLQVSACWFPM